MYKIFLPVLLMVLIPVCLNSQETPADAGKIKKKQGTYHDHQEIIDMYREKCEKFPGISTFKVIGKTCLNNDIYAFYFGNPHGGKIIIDGCLHGWEDLGSEIAFIWITWLLESRDPLALKILKENCWIVIPVVNFDTYDRGNMNHSVCSGGVDLNRNFVHNWEFVPGCTGDYGTSHGEIPSSEPETKVLRSFMDANKPVNGRKSVYINTHYGGGPWIHYNGNDKDGYFSPLRKRILGLWDEQGIVLKNIKTEHYLPAGTGKGTPGGLAGDAAGFGYQAFTIETLNQNCINGHKFAPVDAPCTGQKGESRHLTWEALHTELYPIFRQFFIAVSESVAKNNL